MALATGCSLMAPCLLAAGTNGQPPGQGLVIRSWGVEAGLPQNTVEAIVQTRDGYLWLGTRDGLARFDGVRFTRFGLPEGLQSVEVRTLCEDHQDGLWIGTGGGGVSRLVEGRIQKVTLPERTDSGGVVLSLAEDAQGRMWIGTLAGLSLWQEGRLVQSPALAALERAVIRVLLPNQRGGMWIATEEGLFEFQDGQLAESRGPLGHERIQANCLLEDQAGNLWAGIGNGRVLCRRAGKWVRYDENDGLPFGYVTCLAQEADGRLWAGTLAEGLFLFEAGRFVAVTRKDGLSSDDIRSLRPDREGNLWVGTRIGGLNRLSRRKLASYGAAQGLTNDFMRSVAEAKNGTLWVGTSGGGLYYGGAAGFNPFFPVVGGRGYTFVESVLAAPDGSLWWGCARALLQWKEGHLAAAYTQEPWLRLATVSALCDDRQGGLWIGTSEGRLQHFQNGQFVAFPHPVARGAITALAVQPDRWLWVGSVAGGVKGLRAGSDSVLSLTNGLLSQAIRTLYWDGQGTLWIGTAGGGLSWWRQGRLANFTSRQGLAADTVSQILEDDQGYLWLGCSRGICRLRKSELYDLAAGKIAYAGCRTFGVTDGLPAEECSSGFCPAGLKTQSGLLCFTTVKGLVVLDPREQETNASPPSVLLEEVLVNGQVQPLQRRGGEGLERAPAGASTNQQPLWHLLVPPGGRQLELHYTAISFSAPEEVRFRYRLAGLDHGWIEARNRRVAHYHLPAGDFVFHLLASNAQGVWSAPSAPLAISVRPYLWETPSCRVAVGLAAAGLLAGALRLAERRRYRRQLARLQTQHAIEKERLRISRDMHDDIGGILTQVSQLSDLGKAETASPVAARGRFEHIGRHTRAAIRALDEIVWATNPKNDNLLRFAEYVSRFADEFFEETGVRCWQEVPTLLPEAPLQADLRHNMFLAVKEALNNVLKHSRASQVWLRLGIEDGTVCLSVRDDGVGFAAGKTGSWSNGLENMNARLAEWGGRMELATAPSQGTVIRFVFPLPGAK